MLKEINDQSADSITDIEKECRKLFAFKPKFEKARKENYRQALDGWSENFGIEKLSYSWNDKCNEIISDPISDELQIDTNIFRKNYISICPTNATEIAEFISWYKEIYPIRTEKINLDFQKASIIKILAVSESKIEYLSSLLLDCKEKIRTQFLGDDPLNRREFAYEQRGIDLSDFFDTDKQTKEFNKVQPFAKKIFLDKKLLNKEPEWGNARISQIRTFYSACYFISLQRFLEEQIKKLGSIDPDKNKEIVEESSYGSQKWNLRTRFYLLEKLGFIDMNYFKDNSIPQGKKHELLSKILGCSPRNAKKYFNGEELADEQEKIEVNLYLRELK